MTWHHDFVMDFVRNHPHSMLPTDFSDSYQFLPCPHSSARIVRVAQQVGNHLVVGAFPFEVLEIYFIAQVVLPSKRTFHNFAAVVLDGREEAVIHRSGNQHFVAWHTDGLDDARDGWHHTDGVLHPFALHLPTMPTAEPLDDSIVVGIRHLRVTKHAVLHALRECFPNGWSRLEVHVCHPQRQHVFFFRRIPLV